MISMPCRSCTPTAANRIVAEYQNGAPTPHEQHTDRDFLTAVPEATLPEIGSSQRRRAANRRQATAAVAKSSGQLEECLDEHHDQQAT
jgi:hypothetical protein